MDLMTEYLARAVIQQRIAAAEEGREGRRLERERRRRRRRERRATHEVASLLDAAAYRVDEHGTPAERRLLGAVAKVSEATAPGAAAALVDWSGTEVSRLRAFGLLHAHVVRVLGGREHASLLAMLEDDVAVENCVA
jgi:hypothetical protein